MIDQTSHNYRPSPNEIEQLKASEIMKRRKMRILQVRHQSKIHSSFTRRLYNERLQKRLYREAQNLRNQQIINDTMMLRKNQMALDSVMGRFGNAHQVASSWKDPIVEEEKRQIESKVVEQKRYEEACNDLKSNRVKSQHEAEMRNQYREMALHIERKRAAAIATLPSPQPDPLEPHFKQNSTDCTLCPGEKPKEYHLVVEVNSPKQQNLLNGDVQMKIEKGHCDVNVNRRTESTSGNAENAFAAAHAENERAELERQRVARIAAEAAFKAQIRDQLALKRVQAMQEYQQVIQQIGSLPTSNAHEADLALSDQDSFKGQEDRYPCSDLSRLGPSERDYLPPLMISVHQTTSFQPPQSSTPEQSINEENSQTFLVPMAQIREDSHEMDQDVFKSGNVRFATSPELVELESGPQITPRSCRELSDYERKKRELDSEVESLDREIREIRELYKGNLQTKLQTQEIGEKLPPHELVSESLLRILDEQPTVLESTEPSLDEISLHAISNNGDNEIHQTEPHLLPSSTANEQSVPIKAQADEILLFDTASVRESSDSVTLTGSSHSRPNIKDEDENAFITTETVKTETIPISDSLRRRVAELIHLQKERIRSLKEGTILTPPSSGISSGSSTDFEFPPTPPNESSNQNSCLSCCLNALAPSDVSSTSSDAKVVDFQSGVEQTARSVKMKQEILQNYLKRLLGTNEEQVAPLASNNLGSVFETQSHSTYILDPLSVRKSPKLAITNLSVISEETSQHSDISSIRKGVKLISLDSSRSSSDDVNISSSSSRKSEVNDLGLSLSPRPLGSTNSESNIASKTSSSGHSPYHFTELSSLSSKISVATDSKEIIHNSKVSSLCENVSSVAISLTSLSSVNSKSEPSIRISNSDQTLGHSPEILSHHSLASSQSSSELDLSSVSSGSMKRKVAVIRPEQNTGSRQQTPSSSRSNPSESHSTASHRKIAIVKSARESESGGDQANATSDLTQLHSGAYPSANFQHWSYESAVFSGDSNATLKMVKSPPPPDAGGGECCGIKSPTALTCTPSPNRNGVWFKTTKYNLQHLGSGESMQNLANSLETVSTPNSSSRPSNQFSNLSSASSARKESPQFPTNGSNTATTLQILRNGPSRESQSGSSKSSQQRHTSASTLSYLRCQDEPLSPISSDLSSLLYSNNSSPVSSCKDEPSPKKIITSSVILPQIQTEISSQVLPQSFAGTGETPKSSNRPLKQLRLLSPASSGNDLNYRRSSNTATTLEILREGLSSDSQSGSDRSSQMGSTSASTLTLLKRNREPLFRQSALNHLENSPAATTLSLLLDGLSTMDTLSTSDRLSQLQHFSPASTLTLLRRHELPSNLFSNNSNVKEQEEPFRNTPQDFDIRRLESTQSSGSVLDQPQSESIISNSHNKTGVKCKSSPGCQETEYDSLCEPLDNSIFYSTADICLTTNTIIDLNEHEDCEELDCKYEITLRSCSPCDSPVEQGRCHDEDSVACAIKNVLDASPCPPDGGTTTRFYSGTACKAIEVSVTPRISSPIRIHTSPKVNVTTETPKKISTGEFTKNTTGEVNGETFTDVFKEEYVNEVKFNTTISLRPGGVVKQSIVGSGKGTHEVVPKGTTYGKIAEVQGGNPLLSKNLDPKDPSNVLEQNGRSDPNGKRFNMLNRDEIDPNSFHDSAANTPSPKIISTGPKLDSNFKSKSRNELLLHTNTDKTIKTSTDPQLHPQNGTIDSGAVFKRPIYSNKNDGILGKSSLKNGKIGFNTSLAKTFGKTRSRSSSSITKSRSDLKMPPNNAKKHNAFSKVGEPAKPENVKSKLSGPEKSPLGSKYRSLPNLSGQPKDLPNKDELDANKYGSLQSTANFGSRPNSGGYRSRPDNQISTRPYRSVERKAKLGEKMGSLELNKIHPEDSSAQFISGNDIHSPGIHVRRSKLFRSKTSSKDSDANLNDTVNFKEVAERGVKGNPPEDSSAQFVSGNDIHLQDIPARLSKLFRSKTTSKDSDANLNDTVNFKEVAKREVETKPVAERLKIFESKPDSSRQVVRYDAVESEQKTNREGPVSKFGFPGGAQLHDSEPERSMDRDNQIAAYSSKERQADTLEAYRDEATRSTDENHIDAGRPTPVLKSVSPKQSYLLDLEGSKAAGVISPGIGGVNEDSKLGLSEQMDKLVTFTSGSSRKSQIPNADVTSSKSTVDGSSKMDKSAYSTTFPSGQKESLSDLNETSTTTKGPSNAIRKNSASRNLGNIKSRGSKSPSVQSGSLGNGSISETREKKTEMNENLDEEDTEKKISSLTDQVKSDTDAREITTQPDYFAEKKIENADDVAPSISGAEAMEPTGTKVEANFISDTKKVAIGRNEISNDQRMTKDELKSLDKYKAAISVGKSPRNGSKASGLPPYWPRSKWIPTLWNRKRHMKARLHKPRKRVFMMGENIIPKAKPMTNLPEFLTTDTTAALARMQKINRRLNTIEPLSRANVGHSISITPTYKLPQQESAESSTTIFSDRMLTLTEPVIGNRGYLLDMEVEEILSESFPFERFHIKKKTCSSPRSLYH